MSKFLLLTVVLFVAVAVWRYQHRPQQRRPAHSAAPKNTANRTPTAMLRCAHCGVHVPHNEAVQHQGQSYCSPEHRQQGPGRS